MVTCSFILYCCHLQELESHVTPLNAEYWGCLLTLAEHELEALQLQAEAEKQQGGGLQQQQQQYAGYGGFGGYSAAAAAAVAAVAPPRAIGAPLVGHGPGGVHSALQKDIEALLSGEQSNQVLTPVDHKPTSRDIP